jgi:DNA-binding beta-propeller fold protein YncE
LAAIIGRIPVGISPIALTFSKDERWLFTTSEIADPEWGWPRTIVREGARSDREKVPEGAVIVIDALKARLNPQHSVVARIAAGGSPVRAALSPDGTRLFVTARNSDAVLVFETADLTSGHDRVKPVVIPVGKSPVPVILTNDGRFALVGNSNRFSADVTKNSTLSVLETSRVGTALDPVIGYIPCGAFPRNFCLGSDGRSLFLTNFQSASILVIDSDRLPELLVK